jgi:hypothetical protein
MATKTTIRERTREQKARQALKEANANLRLTRAYQKSCDRDLSRTQKSYDVATRAVARDEARVEKAENALAKLKAPPKKAAKKARVKLRTRPRRPVRVQVQPRSRKPVKGRDEEE